MLRNRFSISLELLIWSVFTHMLNTHNSPNLCSHLADVIQSKATYLYPHMMFRPFGICHVPLPESHIEGGEKKKPPQGNSKVEFLVYLSTCHTLKEVRVLISGKKVCQSRVPGRGSRLSQNPQRMLNPLRLITGISPRDLRSFFKVFPHPESLICQKNWD